MKIICPVCKEELKRIDKSYQCNNKHNFDIAKEGYVNLYLKSAVKSGDEKNMIHARTNFLTHDYYAFLREELNKLFKEYHTSNLVDLGCGEGYYTSYFDVRNKIGIDLSKEGLKQASKKDKTTTYILSSIFNTPIQSNSVDTVLTCFAPVAKEEIYRILKDSGIFILVHPNKRHLYELKQAIYDHPYENELETIEIPGLTKIKEYSISNSATLNNQIINDLFMMTPYYHNTSDIDKEKLNSIDELSITFDFIISIYERNPE